MIRPLAILMALVSIFATSIGGSPVAADDSFPNKPITIINPLPVGSAPDDVVRLVGEQLTQIWGQRVVIDNRPAGGGTVAAQAVASASPDGYTLLLGASALFTIFPVQKNKLTIDINRDLVPIGLMGGGAMYLAVSPKLGVNSLPEFIALARAHPNSVVIGTNAAGTLPNFAALALAKKADIPVIVAPYGSGGTLEAIRDIMGGRVQATVEALSPLRGPVKSGDLKLIAVMSSARNPLLPNVPTVSETLPGFTAVGFLSLAAPARTPEPIVRRLNEGLRRALETPSVKRRLEEFDMVRPILTPTETRAYINAEEKDWWPMVKQLDQIQATRSKR